MKTYTTEELLAITHEYKSGFIDAELGIAHKDGKGKHYDRGYSDGYAINEQQANSGGQDGNN